SRSSTGFEISPALQFSFPMAQTTLSFGYVYDLKYYENKPVNNTENYDQTHDFSAALTHAFSERYQISVRDSFVIGQEPDMLRAGNTFNTFQRISGDNLRNYGTIVFSAQITPKLGMEIGYANTYYSYADNQQTLATDGSAYSASLSGLMDEIDHVAHVDLRYQLQPQTIGVLGYQARVTEYIGDQAIGFYQDTAGNPVRVMSDERNAFSQYGYLGLDHNFRPDLNGVIRAGARFTDYYNNPAGQNDVGPYLMASLRYTYLPESYLQAGLNWDYSPSSVFSANNAGDLTLNAQSASIFVSLNHRITPKLHGSIIAQFQNSVYYGGMYNNQAENYFLLGLNLQYRFTPNFSAEVGYNYDNVNSEVAAQPGFDRNRVYVGVTGSY
ncbi:MAG: outer membrane beta-barrel protein, partial [Planctomycetota bacterium]|nr:outer membrane beta-barrel protein [Planctomycetota bacterium]